MIQNKWAIDLRDVCKTYQKKVQALRDVNLQVGQGEIFGLLGPNGAGKSTLVKIMMSVVHPDRAAGTILDHPLGRQELLQKVGYLAEGHHFPNFLTGQQVLDFYGTLSKVPLEHIRHRSKILLERLNIAQWQNTCVQQYSKGMLQRLGLAQALLHQPDLIVLDEPTDGVDPLGRKEFREIMLELKSQGKTVFINSHILSELEMVCDRVAILVKGQVIRQGTVQELTSHSLIYVISTLSPLAALAQELDKLGATVAQQQITIKGNDASAANQIIDLLRDRGIMIESVRPERWSLEDVFIDAATSNTPQG